MASDGPTPAKSSSDRCIMPAPFQVDGDPFGPRTSARNRSGAFWMIASCLGATGMSVAVRYLSIDLHTIQIAFLRCAFGLWVLIPIFLTRAEAGKHRIQFTRPWLHLLRGGLFVLALTSGFHALAVLPLATATTLFFMAPVFATLLAALFRGESFGPRRAAAIVAAFVGAVIVLRPGFADDEALAMGLAVASAMCFAVALLISRPLSQADGANSVLFSSTALASVALLGPAVWLWAPLAFDMWSLIALLVLASSLRMFADIRAYNTADAGFLAPFAFLRLLFIAAAGWIFFGEGLDQPTTIGAAIIVGSTIFIAWREAVLAKQRR